LLKIRLCPNPKASLPDWQGSPDFQQLYMAVAGQRQKVAKNLI